MMAPVYLANLAAAVLASSAYLHTAAIEPPNTEARQAILGILPPVLTTPKQEAAAAYLAKLQASADDVVAFNAAEFTDSVRHIGMALSVVQAWAELVDQGASLDLSLEQEAARQAFRSVVARKQAAILPMLRDAYGPAVQKQLRKVDGNARTFGAGFKTIEITNEALAVDRQIEAAHDTMRKILLMLRFTRAKYKAGEKRDAHSSTVLRSPGDTAIVIWSADGNWRPAY